ncbi:Serine/threonine-protein kinase, active site [Sesbania bispinosa]|nr:Serine/threonine-protein kinase, active site [Sesbania bispinosa]
MKKPPSSSSVNVTLAVIVILSFLPSSYALGSATTLAVTDASATVCGIVAGESTQRIECYRHEQIVPVVPNVSFSSISGGRDYFCGLRSVGDDQVCATVVGTGTVECWRTNRAFNLSSGSDQFASISSGYGFSCGILRNSSRVQCWGEMGMANRIENEFGNMSMLSLVAGGSHVCGLNSTGVLVCRGSNSSGQLNVPQGGAFEYDGLALGAEHGCAIRRLNGSVVCWGGRGQFSVNVTQGVSFELIVSGSNFTCGLTTSNFSVLCWGPAWSNGNGSSSRFELPLPRILPGPCVQSSCSECVYCLWSGVCFGKKKVHNSVQPTITRGSSNSSGGGASNHSPSSIASTIRRQSSRIMRRQRSGTSSTKHPERAEEFTLSELITATNNFSLENKIGAGSFGVVYKGKLTDGREVAIKRGETGSKMKKYQEKESAFESEIAFLSRLHHKHLVRLVGYCEEKDERLLVYEYMKNGALYDHLHDKNNVEKGSSVLNSWKMRIKIALDASRGIEYLHNYAVPSIIHRDIKSSNILIDATWTARVSDFGLSLMSPESDSEYKPTKAAGTLGYIDPEYYGLNVLTAKSDVYGLGVVLLELLTGKRAVFKHGEDPLSVVDFAVPAILAGELVKILDPRVGPPESNEAEAVELVAYIAMNCVNLEGKDRPTIADIVANLERALVICDGSHDSISSIAISVVSD